MRAKLRTWIGSWQVWVIVACLAYILAYIWGIRGWARAIAAVWPSGAWIAVGLMSLALLVLGGFLLRYLVFPCLMFLHGDKKGGRTAKAEEKLADSLMSMSTAIFSAIWIALFIFPLTAFIQIMASGTDPISALVSWWRPDRWSGWHSVVFLGAFWVPLILALLFRRKALDLYDKLPPSAPAVAPTAQGTREQTTISDPGPPPYARANGGSRRRRRPRSK